MEEIFVYSIYSCDAWRSNHSINDSSLLYRTADYASMNEFIERLVAEKPSYFELDDEAVLDAWERLVEDEEETWVSLVDQQRLPFLHLTSIAVNLKTFEVYGYEGRIGQYVNEVKTNK